MTEQQEKQSIKAVVTSHHEQVRAEYLEALTVWDKIPAADPKQMDLYDSDVKVETLVVATTL